jgi:hypothetical protein
VFKAWLRPTDAPHVHRKVVVGWVLVVLGAIGLARAMAHFEVNSYAMGNLTGGVLIVLLRVWVIRTARPSLGSP